MARYLSYMIYKLRDVLQIYFPTAFFSRVFNVMQLTKKHNNIS